LENTNSFPFVPNHKKGKNKFFVSGLLHLIVRSHAFLFQEGCLVKTTLFVVVDVDSPQLFLPSFKDSYILEFQFQIFTFQNQQGTKSTE
jgi:hypothetical protein